MRVGWLLSIILIVYVPLILGEQHTQLAHTAHHKSKKKQHESQSLRHANPVRKALEGTISWQSDALLSQEVFRARKLDSASTWDSYTPFGREETPATARKERVTSAEPLQAKISVVKQNIAHGIALAKDGCHETDSRQICCKEVDS